MAESSGKHRDQQIKVHRPNCSLLFLQIKSDQNTVLLTDLSATDGFPIQRQSGCRSSHMVTELEIVNSWSFAEKACQPKF